MQFKNNHSYDQRTTQSMQTWIQLLRSYKTIHAKELDFVNQSGLTMNQFEVLEALYHKGPLRIGELTRLIMSTAGNLTVVIKNLKKHGYAEVSACAKDRRASVVSITKLGEDCIAAMFTEHASNLTACFKVINDQELTQLFTLLRRLYKFNRKEQHND